MDVFLAFTRGKMVAHKSEGTMARKTKQERVVQKLSKQLSKPLQDLHTTISGNHPMQSELALWVQGILQNYLDFSSSNHYHMVFNNADGPATQPDMVIMKDNQSLIVVDVLHISNPMGRSIVEHNALELDQYLKQIGSVRWGILTNGLEWKLYDFENNGIEIAYFDIRRDKTNIDFSTAGIEEIAWGLSDFHESIYASGDWETFSKEMNAVSPESIVKAILSADTMKHVFELFRNQNEFKGSSEVLIEETFRLLKSGLDSPLTKSDHTRRDELNRYVREQKKASRKSSPDQKAPTKKESLTHLLMEALRDGDRKRRLPTVEIEQF